MENKLEFRPATTNDIIDIVRMLSEDILGATREKNEKTVSKEYSKAFEIILKDPNQELRIVEMNGEKVGTFQLSFIQYMSHQGGLRAQVEAVRINSKFRGQGIGKKVFAYIIDRARQKGCTILQLTSDKKRPDAISFYETIGFEATHEGMKFKLL
jgi:GNAT superfamily N-acetyltransferase